MSTDRRDPPRPAPRALRPPPLIAGLCSATPASVGQDELWDGFFASHFAHDRLARAAFRRSGVIRRHAVVDPRLEDVSSWSTGARMARFAAEAPVLAKAAAAGALSEAGVEASELGLLCVVSCTGYATPGIDVALGRDLGLSSSAQRLLVGHVGCHAALPALGVLHDHVRTHGTPALLLCLELSSLHLQPRDGDPAQAVVHALFSDAAAAAVVVPERAPASRFGQPSATAREHSGEQAAPVGLEILATASLSDFANADAMTWQVTDTGFRMHLSRSIPDLLSAHVEPLLDGLVARAGLTRDDVGHVVAHPGGPRVLEVVEERLGLDHDALESARTVLAKHGNCSSATVLLVLEHWRTHGRPRAGEHVAALAFGPGLTLCATLLRVR